MIDIIILQSKGFDHCIHPKVTVVSTLDSPEPAISPEGAQRTSYPLKKSRHLDLSMQNLLCPPVRKDREKKGIDLI